MPSRSNTPPEFWGPAATVDGMPKTLADEALSRIREDIISGQWTPAARLQPDILKDRYDIGLSPIREALSRLAAAGLPARFRAERAALAALFPRGLDIVLACGDRVAALPRSTQIIG